MSSKKAIFCDSCGALNRIETSKLKGTRPICGKCSKELELKAKVESVSFDQLEKVIKHSELPVLVDAYADWCGPCKMYGPIFSEVGEKNWERAEFFKIDTEKNPMFSVRYNIRGIPTTLLFYKGKLLKAHSGVLQPHQIELLVDEALRAEI